MKTDTGSHMYPPFIWKCPIVIHKIRSIRIGGKKVMITVQIQIIDTYLSNEIDK